MPLPAAVARKRGSAKNRGNPVSLGALGAAISHGALTFVLVWYTTCCPDGVTIVPDPRRAELARRPPASSEMETRVLIGFVDDAMLVRCEGRWD